jgi:sugar-specific transcriptional regulator TrmB
LGDKELSLRKVLKSLTDIGLKRAEAKVYFYLAKRGPKKASEIVNALKMKKQQLYPLIKSLQNKGIISSSMDRPTKFSAVQFEKVLDFFAKTKIEEAKIIEDNKDKLLSDWESITLPITEDESSRFTVIRGRRYVYSKMQQMIQETKNQLLAILSIPTLMRADYFGLFDETSSP